ncbi:hypothetical protein B484DRAFT_457475 [Ochromonadaceae sp. CCMP2298]|nr:hypothetical protein B484DRAFT_457475 [Ochromonadaceae sp. CCMP2298]
MGIRVLWAILLFAAKVALSLSFKMTPTFGHMRVAGSSAPSFKLDAFPDSLNFPTAKQVGDQAYAFVTGLATDIVNPVRTLANETQKNIPITIALQKLQLQMDVLDNVAGRTPQLSRAELVVLISTVAISAFSPFFLATNVVEVLVPSMAAISASIGLSAEYVGKVEVSKGKEISALAMQAAAEAEAILASAERVKAILPLCVGIATTASAFALLAPSFLRSISEMMSVQVITESLLICPLISVLAASVAGLATQETKDIAQRASGVGSRRFASSQQVGRTWMSAAEQVENNAFRMGVKWKTFAISVLPAPVIAALCPGALGFKAVVCAAVAAAQAAYYLAICEYFLASAVEAVSLKARSSAVADTYANQGARAGSILPFTSALAGLCAAASAASVELLPLVNIVEVQAMITVIFPSGAALFAAAASVAKAKCEVDAAASSVAASRGLTPDGDKERDPINQVKEQVILVVSNTWGRIVTRIKQWRNALKNGKIWVVVKRTVLKRNGHNGHNGHNKTAPERQ